MIKIKRIVKNKKFWLERLDEHREKIEKQYKIYKKGNFIILVLKIKKGTTLNMYIPKYSTLISLDHVSLSEKILRSEIFEIILKISLCIALPTFLSIVNTSKSLKNTAFIYSICYLQYLVGKFLNL